VTPEMLEIVKSSNTALFDVPPSYNAINLPVRKRGINMDMRYCLKIFASWLHHSGISSEVIDFLEGRVSNSVFNHHLFNSKFFDKGQDFISFGPT
jgi:intergrase/recombinase